MVGGKKCTQVSRIVWIVGILVLIPILVYTIYKVNDTSVTFIDDTVPVAQDSLDTSHYAMSLRYSEEYKTWKYTVDTAFHSLFNGTQSMDVLEERPALVILWAGYAFSKSYRSPRGHMYAVDDMRESARTGAPMNANEGPQMASCWSCKSPDVPRVINTLSQDTFYTKTWAALGNEIVNPVGCADCHDEENMTLRITRPFLTEAYRRMGYDVAGASEQEMRSLVCAQCHAEYYFKGSEKRIVLPWDKGLTVEDMERYYDELDFYDFIHKLSRAPILKAQHPDFELARMGIHAQRGVSCGECHMPYVGSEGKRYNDHHIQSPLAMIGRTCQVCHRESEETLRNNVYERQLKAVSARNRLEEELVKAHVEAKFAWEKGASEEQMKGILKLLRQAQWRWDFVVASHGASFHAPQEVQRILGDGLDKALRARMDLMKVLVKLGYHREVSLPDISTKDKAQKYIGLDMAAENEAKRKFLETVVPEWTKEARENKRFIEN